MVTVYAGLFTAYTFAVVAYGCLVRGDCDTVAFLIPVSPHCWLPDTLPHTFVRLPLTLRRYTTFVRLPYHFLTTCLPPLLLRSFGSITCTVDTFIYLTLPVGWLHLFSPLHLVCDPTHTHHTRCTFVVARCPYGLFSHGVYNVAVVTHYPYLPARYRPPLHLHYVDRGSPPDYPLVHTVYCYYLFGFAVLPGLFGWIALLYDVLVCDDPDVVYLNSPTLPRYGLLLPARSHPVLLRFVTGATFTFCYRYRSLPDCVYAFIRPRLPRRLDVMPRLPRLPAYALLLLRSRYAFTRHLPEPTVTAHLPAPLLPLPYTHLLLFCVDTPTPSRVTGCYPGR